MKKLTMAAMFALAAFALQVSAKTYYVKADGGEDVDPKVDKQAGLSEGAAFATIQFAIDNVAAGSTILVYPGEYEPIVSNNKKLTIKAVEGPAETSITGGSEEDGYAPVAAELGAWGTQVQYATIHQMEFSDGTKVKYWEDWDAEYPEDGWDYDAHWYWYGTRFISISPKKPQGWVGYDPPEGVEWEESSDYFGSTKTGRKEPFFKGGKNTTLVGFSLNNGQQAVWGGTVQNCSISGFNVYGSGGIYSSSGDFEYRGSIVYMSSLTDCDIFDNYQGTYSTNGSLLDDVTANRVTIRDNTCSSDVLVAGSSLFNCIVRWNLLYDWGSIIGWGSTIYNSTIVNNELPSYTYNEYDFVPTDESDEEGYFDEDEGFFGKWVMVGKATGYGTALTWNCKAYNTIVWNNLCFDDGSVHNVDTNDFFDTVYTYKDAKGKTVTKRYDAYSQFVNSCTDVLVNTPQNKKVKSTGNVAADPCFIDWDDYRLAPWSPCVDMGGDYTKQTGKLDLDGFARKVGAKVDMGAYELQASTPVPADYDGDGVTDAALYFADSGTWWVWGSQEMLYSGMTAFSLPAPKGATPIAADFDGSGMAQPGYFAGAEKEPFFVHVSHDMWNDEVTTNAFATYTDASGKAVSTKGAIPVTAKFTKDSAKATFGIYASTAKAPVYSFLGTSALIGGDAKVLPKGSLPVVADFDGDGVDDLGAYTATAAKPAFTVLQSGSRYSPTSPFMIPSNFFYPAVRTSVPLGAKNSIPCCADFDGDGLADFATYSATASAPEFTRLCSTSKYSETRTLPMGSKGDVPVVGVYEEDQPAAPAVWTGSVWTYLGADWGDKNFFAE